LQEIKDIQENPTATEQEVIELMQQILGKIPSGYLTVDAVDECSSFGSRTDEFFQRIAFIPRRFKILITSRTPANIRKDLSMIHTPLKSLEILPEYSKSDLDHFIDQSINNASFSKDNGMIDAIRSRLSRCDGMFLWVKLMVEHLQLQTCEYEMLNCLEELPEGLPQTYDGIMERINQLSRSQRMLAHRVLFWVITARRPLSVSEVQVLLAVQPKIQSFDERRMITDADSSILAVCGGMISYRGLEKKIYCTHFTVTEYLEQYLQRQDVLKEVLACYDARELTSNESLAAAVCLRYLCYSFIGLLHPPRKSSDAEELISRKDTKLTLLSYASSNWFIHTKSLSSPDPLIIKLGLQFLDEASPNLELWWRLYWFSVSLRWEIAGCPSNFSSFHVVAYFGLSQLMEALLSQKLPSLVDSEQRTPLWWAASEGHAVTLKILINAGFNPDFPDSFSFTPSHLAATHGHTKAFEEILVKAQPTMHVLENMLGQSPLHSAAFFGCKAIIDNIVQIISDRHCTKYGTPAHRANDGQTAVHLAAFMGHDAVLESLLSYNKDEVVNIQDFEGYTPLHLAVIRGRETIVAKLLELGADRTIPDRYGRTATQIAMEHCSGKIYDFLTKTAPQS
jgi:ankyrin repeat protein